MNITRSPHRLCALILGIIVLSGVAGCGSDSSDAAGKTDKKRSATALTAGLKAQTAGKLGEAEKHYREALKHDGKNKIALYDLALIDAARLNFGLAAEKYQLVLAIDPHYGPALYNLAILEKDKGNDRGAISLYRRAIAASPKDAASHLNLGLLLRAAGDKAEGDVEVTRAIRLDPQLRDPAATPKKAKSPASP